MSKEQWRLVIASVGIALTVMGGVFAVGSLKNQVAVNSASLTHEQALTEVLVADMATVKTDVKYIIKQLEYRNTCAYTDSESNGIFANIDNK